MRLILSESSSATLYIRYDKNTLAYCYWYMVLNSYKTSDSMVKPQMDCDRFRNVSNLDPVELKQIRNLIYACIRLLSVK